MKNSTHAMIVAALLGQLATLSVRAAGRGGSREPKQVQLEVEAAPVPRPALKYMLVHEMIDQTPGNAAIAYQRAIRMLARTEQWSEQARERQKWLEAPLDELPLEEAKLALSKLGPALQQIERASRHERCDWETPVRLDGINALLPHLADMRDAARVLALDARILIREGRYDEAIQRLRTGFVLAKHMGDGALLIEGLVGLAIGNKMLDQVELLIQQPNAPNLYWAISDLPPAYLSPWRATRWERCFLYVHIPSLRDYNSKELSGADFRQAVRDLQSLSGGDLRAGFLSPEENVTLAATGLALAVYPKAKRHLAEQGVALDELERMSAGQAVVAYLGGAYAEQRDNLFKWLALPYPEAREGLARAEKDLKAAIANDPLANVLPSLSLPAVSHAGRRFAEFDRRLALLRTVEAVRAYAADHNGRLPESLKAIEALPIPPDPMTGSAFGYRLEGNTAILKAPKESDQRPETEWTYEIGIRR